MKQIGLGIIGGGIMGRAVTAAVRRWPELITPAAVPQVVSVASRTAQSLEWFKNDTLGVAELTTDYRMLLSNPRVDAVYVAVPHHLHEEIYGDVLRAGKHLLGEKPFGIDLVAANAIAAEARRHPELVVRCASQWPYYPGAQRIVGAAREGQLGKIIEVEVGFLHASDLDPLKPVNWKRQVATCGEYGVMADLGLHVLYAPLRLGWQPRDVRAILRKLVSERPDAAGGMAACDTWDNATLLCAVPSDAGTFPLTAKFMRIAPGETNSWYIHVLGTQMSMRYSTRQPKTLSILDYQRGRPQTWQEESLGYEVIYKTIAGSNFEFGFGDAMLQMMAAYVEQLVKGPQAELTFGCATMDEAIASHHLFTAALRSHAHGRVEPVGA